MDLSTHQFLRQLLLIVAASLAVLIIFGVGLSYYGRWSDERLYGSYPVSYNGCNIAVVPLRGDITAFDTLNSDGTLDMSSATISGDSFERSIRYSESDPNILGIIVQIDSYGGLGSAALQMLQALERAKIPVAAYIREAGTSGAYMAALGADTIVASPFAEVGSIGVTYSYLNQAEKNKKDGLTYEQLSSGRFKDAGSPDKPLTAEERALFQRNVQAFSDVFKDLVATHRKLSTTTVATLADGQAWPASLALENHLIDYVGDDDTVKHWFAEQLDMDPESIIFCN